MIEPLQNITSPCYVKVRSVYTPPVAQTKPLKVIYLSPPQPTVVRPPHIILLPGSSLTFVGQKPPAAAEACKQTSDGCSTLISELLNNVDETNVSCENSHEQNNVLEYKQESSCMSDNNLRTEKMDESKLPPPVEISAVSSVPINLPPIKAEKSDESFVKYMQEHDSSMLIVNHTAKECSKTSLNSSYAHSSESCECEVCYVKLTTKSELRKCVCRGESEDYTCKVCYRQFVNKFALNSHMVVHKAEKTVECTRCLEKFTQKDLVRHVCVHEKESETCLKFTTDSELSSQLGSNVSRSQQSEVGRVMQGNENSSERSKKSGGEPLTKPTQESDSCMYEVSQSGRSFQSSAESRQFLVTCKMEEQDGVVEESTGSDTFQPFVKCKVEKPDVEECHKCNTCFRIFVTKSELSEHVLACTSKKSFTCDVCSKTFDRKFDLTLHVSTHTSDYLRGPTKSQKQERRKSNKCEKCSRTFLTTWELLAHMKNHSVLDSHQGSKKFGLKTYLPRQTLVKSYSKQAMLEYSHHLGNTEGGGISVLDTSKCCGPVEEITEENNVTFTDQKLASEESPGSDFCNEASKEAREQFVELSDVSGNLLMTCKIEVPDDGFQDFKVEPDEFQSEEFHSCNTCSMKFATKAEFSSHLSTHKSKKFHTCNVCFKKFAQKYSLTRHMTTHVSGKTLECSVCSKKFARKDTLTRHLQLHWKDKPHECGKCHERFEHQDELVSHMVSHEDQDANQCTVCSQKFPKSQFAMHMLSHVNKNFLKCPLCSKYYKKKSSLFWHLENCHEEGKPQECSKCLKSFKTRLELRRHTLADKNDASYDCVRSELPSEGGKPDELKESGTNNSGPLCSGSVGKVEECPDKITEKNLTDVGESCTKLTAAAENNSSEELYECEDCPQKFSTEEALSSHRLSHKRKLYKCDVCSREFTQGSHLSRHMVCHGGEKAFECNICSEKFARKENLTRHLLNHVGERPHKCEVCSKKFTMKCDLSMHMLIHTGQRSHACTLCPKKFARKSHLSRHTLTHTGEKPHACSLCPERFARRTDLTMHEATHKGEKADECEICHKKFARRDNLAKHLLTHKGLKPHKCKICSWKFARKYNLTKHMLTHTGVREHECEICAKKFVTKSNLFIHLLTHTREKLFECEVCNKKFTTKSNVKVHMMLHKVGVELECEVCTKKFRNKYRLARHLSITHLGVKKKYSCEVCMKKFTSKFLVQRHMLSHTGEKRHECEICSKRFGQKETLTRHMLIHSGEKPHECTICFKKFTQRMALSKHLLIHTGELPYECDFCPQKFTHRNYLSRHLLTHTEKGVGEEGEEILGPV